MSEVYLSHQSVLLEEVTKLFSKPFMASPNPILLDLTFGAGGHTCSLLHQFSQLKAVGFDQDREAIENGIQRLNQEKLNERSRLVHANFSTFSSWWSKQNPPPCFQGILADLGVSSHQFDAARRGFSFRFEGPLDMRMDATNADIPTAADIVNHFSLEELVDVFQNYGEERYSRKIAQRIVEQRASRPYRTTKDLEETCFLAYPPPERFKGIHPATRVFQALRIQVNQEMKSLESAILDLYQALAPNGVLAIISFHSLEDRIVKHAFKELMNKFQNEAIILTRKPLLPTAAEIERNSRSRSAKLRAIMKSHDTEVFRDFKAKKKFISKQFHSE